MKKTFVCLAVVLFAGCSASPSRLAAVAKQEAGRLGVPSQPLSTFGAFELKTMKLSKGTGKRRGEAKLAQQLEDKLRARLVPLFEQWKEDTSSPRTGGTLVIQPELQTLHIVSGARRQWQGASSGDSLIDLDLTLTDGKTGTIIANPRISRTASAAGGAWTKGKTDRNLLDYVVEIAYQYLADNYKK
jgi:hypothetical protein